LVAGADPGACVAVEILVERNMVTPVRVALEIVVVSPHSSPPITLLIPQEDLDQAPG
jgi:hypothetical protein